MRSEPIQIDVNGNAAAIDIRGELDRVQGDDGPGFEISGLPDSGGTAITLLTFQLEIVPGIIDAQYQTMVFTGSDVRG